MAREGAYHQIINAFIGTGIRLSSQEMQHGIYGVTVSTNKISRQTKYRPFYIQLLHRVFPYLC